MKLNDPCPICGATCYAEQATNGKYYVKCGYCPISTDPIFNSAEEAAAYWWDRQIFDHKTGKRLGSRMDLEE